MGDGAPSVAGLSASAFRRWSGAWVVAACCLLAAASLTVAWTTSGPVADLALTAAGTSVDLPGVVESGVAAALVVLGATVVLRGRAHRYGWLLLVAGVAISLNLGAGVYSLYALYAVPAGTLPAAAAAAWVQDLWMTWFLFGLLLLPALFPDGRAAPSWRQPVRVTVVGWVVLTVTFAFADRPLSNVFVDVESPPANPAGVLPIPLDVFNSGFLLLTAATVVVAAGSLGARWRRADGEIRQQLKWVLYAFVLVAAVAGASTANTVAVEVLGVDLGLDRALETLMRSVWVAVVGALGLGVLRYRLYDVDLVINRTLVYGVMTALVVLSYGVVVVGVAALVPGADGPGPSLLATALVAVAFNPVRRLVQRGVNRLMFGRRDDPYTVLSQLFEQLARSGDPGTTLQTVVETVATALKLPGVALELERDGGWERRAVAGSLTGEHELVPLEHHGRLVGRLVVARRSPGEPLHADDRRLLVDVAHHAGAVAHGVRLTAALQRSREELVHAREEERRRLRRDLHDGLGPALASQTFRLDAVLGLLDDDPRGCRRQVRELKRQTQELVAEVRRLVHELRPPALDELGLVGALAAHAGQLAGSGRPAIEVVTTPAPLGPLPAGVEVAAYRIAQEAVTNVVRHAAASTCTVELRRGPGILTVRVADDGVGVAPGTPTGVGTAAMRERAEELGGTLSVAPRAGDGTVVAATLPVVDPAPATSAASAAAGSAPQVRATAGIVPSESGT